MPVQGAPPKRRVGQNKPGPSPPVAHPINQRAATLPSNFVRENPLTATRLVLSNVPTSVLQKFGAGVAQNYEWMKSISGPGAMFMTARAKAYTINDPAMRAVAQGVIDSLQSATERSQQLAEQAAQEPVSRLRAAANIQAASSFTYDQGGTRIEVDPRSKHVVLPTNDMSDPAFRAAYGTLKAYFPDWTIEVVPANDNVRALHDVLGFVGKGLDAVGTLPFKALDVTVGKIPGPIGGNARDLAKLGESVVTTGFGRATDIAAGAVAQTGYYLSGNFHPIPKDWYWPDAPGTAFGNYVADSVPSDPLHDPLGLHHVGISATNPARDTVAQGADLIAGLLVAHGTGEFARGFKEGRTAVVQDPLNELPSGVKARGILNQAGYDLTSKPISEWNSSPAATRFARSIDAFKAKYGGRAGAVITKRYGQDTVPTQLANIIDHTASGTEATAAFIRYIQNAPDTELLTRMKSRLGQIDSELRGNLTGERLSQLKAEKAQIEDQLSQVGRPGDRAPIRKLPTRYVLEKARLQESKLGQLAHGLYNPSVRWAPHISRLFDSLGRTVIRDPHGPSAGPEVFRENEHTTRNYLGRAGVPENIIDSLVDQLNKTTSSDQHFEVMKRFGTIFGRDAKFVAGDGRGWMSRIIKEQNPNVFLRSQIERTVEQDGKTFTTHEGVLPKNVAEGRYDYPSMSAEMIGDFHLPAVEGLVEYTSLTRQMVRFFRNHKMTAPLGLTLDTAFFLSRVLTAYSKVAILAPRLVGALFFRIQGEQVAREKFYGVPIFSEDFKARWHLIRDSRTKDFAAPTEGLLRQKVNDWALNNPTHDLAPFEVTRQADGTATATATIRRRDVAEHRRFKAEAPNESLGTLMLNYDQGPPTVKDWRPVQMVDPVTGALSDEGKRAAMQNLIQRSVSPEMVKLVELNGDTTAWVKWLNSDLLGRRTKRMFGDIVSKADLGSLTGDARFREWGKRSWESIKQETGGNEGLLDMIRTGTWNLREPFATGAVEAYDGALADRYRQRLDDLANVRSSLDDAIYASDHDLIRALSEDRKRIIDELDAIERESGAQPRNFQVQVLAPTERAGYFISKKRNKVTLGAQEDFMGALGDAYERGTYKPPAQLNGYVMKVEQDTDATLADRMRAWRGTSLYGLLSPMTRADLRFTRGSLFAKLASEEYRRLRGFGYSEDQAFAHAKAYSARMTTDIMYDLSDRSSAQRALRNVFWFGPAWQELLTTWGVKIPSRYYWPVGIATMYEQAHLMLNLVKQMGLIQKDPGTGRDVIIVPGLGQALSKLTGSKVPDTVYGYPSGLNLLATGWPGASVQANLAVEGIARSTNSSLMQGLNNWIHQFSPATRSVPSSITYAWEATFGTRPPFEFLHPDYQDQLVNMGWNAAMAQARVDLGPPPQVGDYPSTAAGQKSYTKAIDAYRADLINKAHGTFKAWALVSFLGATVSPMSLHVTDKYRQDAGVFYNSLFSKHETAAEIAQKQQAFIEAHPGGIGYITSKTYLTGKGPQIPYTRPNQNTVYNQIYEGTRRAFTPEEYSVWLMGLESRRVIIGRLQQELDKIGTTGPDLLLHRYDRNAALAEYHRSWDQYVAWNDTPGTHGGRSFADLWNDRSAIYQKLGVTPYQDFQVSQVTDAYRLLDEYRGHFEPNGLSNSSYETVRAEFAKLMSAGGPYGAPSTPAGKGMAWYMDKVYGPYLDHLQPLYKQAGVLVSEGKDPSSIYDEIRRYEEKYSRLATSGKIKGPDGLTYPDPQAVAFGNKSPAQRREDQIHYATEPVAWLTAFQRTQAGYDTSFKIDPANVGNFFSYQAWLDTWVQKYEDAHGIVSYSSYGQEIQKWRTESLRVIASGGGGQFAKQQHIQGSPELAHLFSLSEGPPIGRLVALGYGRGEPGHDTFLKIAQWADYANRAISAQGLSPAGDSAYAISVKKWLYNAIDTARHKDPGFDSLMTDVSLALPIKDQYREGPLLYQAVFFDNFASKVASVYYKTPAAGVGPYNVAKWERTYANGKIPTSAMTNIGRGYYLQPAAADAFQAAEVAAQKDGLNLLAGVISAYRSYAEQASLVAHPQGNPTAAPGTSNHGWGLALDVQQGTRAWTWMVNNGSRYGWAHREPGADPNHFTFNLAPGV